MTVFAAETTRSPVLVTGGAGFIGSRLVEALVARGERVRVLDDLSSGSRANLAAVLPEIEVLIGDVRDRRLLVRALHGASTVFHLAALATVAGSLRDPQRTLSVNVDGTRALLLEAAAAGVGRVVLASSAAVYGETTGLPLHEQLPPQPLSPYALSKLAAEQMVLAFARRTRLTGVVLRCFNVYGPRQDAYAPSAGVIARFCRAGLDGVPCLISGDGEQCRDFVYVDDVVQANLLAADTALSGVVLNVARGEAITLWEIVAALEDALGRPLARQTVPARPGEIRSSLADIRAAQAMLGYRPQIGLREGLAQTLAWQSGLPERGELC